MNRRPSRARRLAPWAVALGVATLGVVAVLAIGGSDRARDLVTGSRCGSESEREARRAAAAFAEEAFGDLIESTQAQDCGSTRAALLTVTLTPAASLDAAKESLRGAGCAGQVGPPGYYSCSTEFSQRGVDADASAQAERVVAGVSVSY